MTGPTLADIPRDSPFSQTTEFSELRSESPFCLVNGHAYSPGTLQATADEFQRQIRPPEYLWCSRCGDVIWVGTPEAKDND